MDPFDTAIVKIQKHLAVRGRLLVTIDGACGGGKSALGEFIQEHLGGNLFHTDDFYLPFERRSPDWKKVPTRNMDLKRLREEVFIPASSGERIVYGAYDPHRRKLRSIAVAPEALSVVEGSYSQHPVFAAYTDFRIFIKCDGETMRKRLSEREGGDISAYEELWIPLSEQFFREYRVEERADLVLDTSDKKEQDSVKDQGSPETVKDRRKELESSLEFFRRSSFWNK